MRPLATSPSKVAKRLNLDVDRPASRPPLSCPTELWQFKVNDGRAIYDDDHQVSSLIRSVGDDMEGGPPRNNAINDFQQIPIERSGITRLCSR